MELERARGAMARALAHPRNEDGTPTSREPKPSLLLRQLADERSKKVVFVSHCLLNENVRYAGGAFRPGGVDEVVDELQEKGLGIVQMRCPEQRAWGGVLKTYVVPAYGSKGSVVYRARRPLLWLFAGYTRVRFWFAARDVVRDVADYVRHGFTVVGIVGVGGSPSCGVCTTLDLGGAMERMAACPIADLDRDVFNDEVIAANAVAGEGLFIASIRRRLRRRHIDVPFYEHELMTEMKSRLAARILPDVEKCGG